MRVTVKPKQEFVVIIEEEEVSRLFDIELERLKDDHFTHGSQLFRREYDGREEFGTRVSNPELFDFVATIEKLQVFRAKQARLKASVRP